ncbi:MAG: hypothetical protein ABI823_21985, partial [Bryobacteraceae bacterium]
RQSGFAPTYRAITAYDHCATRALGVTGLRVQNSCTGKRGVRRDGTPLTKPVRYDFSQIPADRFKLKRPGSAYAA